MSASNTTSAPYTRKMAYTLLIDSELSLGSIVQPGAPLQHSADICSGSMSRGFIPDSTSLLDLSTRPFDAGCATDATTSIIFLSQPKRANAPSEKFVQLSLITLCGYPYIKIIS